MHIRSKLSLIVSAGFAATILASTSAMADPVLWELEAARGDGRLVANGSFVYDADTNVFSDIEIAATDTLGSDVTNTTYTILSPFGSSSASEWTFFDSLAGPDRTGQKFMTFLLFGRSLTNDGGIIDAAGFGLFVFLSKCTDSTCNGTSNIVLGGSQNGIQDTIRLTGTPVVIDEDNDGVLDTADLCPGTVIPEAAPTSGSLGNGRHALMVFGSPNFNRGGATNAAYSTVDTAGCSCEQIVDELFLGKGHLKNGCSNSVMESWVNGLPFDPANP